MIPAFAGRCYVDQYESLSLADLFVIGTERQKTQWELAAHIAAWSFNANPFLKKLISANELNPLLSEKQEPRHKMSLRDFVASMDSK